MNDIDFTRPYAIVKRKEDPCALIMQGEIMQIDQLANIPYRENNKNSSAKEEQFETISAIPFSQIKERGFKVHDDGTKISCLKIDKQISVPLDELLKILPNETIELENEIKYNYSKKEYENIVQRVIKDEIGNGEGANFVIPRKGSAQIQNMNPDKVLAIFKNLLIQEYGSHWTFIFFDGEKYLIGASPETHVAVKNGRVKMHPISGTFRKNPSNGDIKKTRKEFIKFLSDQKEINELFMVVDEELKMMANLCSEGGMIIGPLLKEMSHLIHTEYLLSGKSHKNIIDILKESMFAATVTGSPLENACNIIHKYETQARRFYSSCLVMIGQDENGEDLLDGAITIRTMEISKEGHISFGVGATLVRDSVPSEEVKETESKIEAVLRGIQNPTNKIPEKIIPHFEEDDEILELMQSRNQKLSRFWFFSQEDEDNILPELNGKKVLMINNEDDFCYMMKHMFTSMGAKVEIIKFNDYNFDTDHADLTVIGPGPGNPNNTQDPKMQKLMQITKNFLNSDRKFFAVCLGNQFLCRALNIEVSKKDNPFH